MEDIKDKLGAIFKAYSKTTKDKVDKVDKTKLLEHYIGAYSRRS